MARVVVMASRENLVDNKAGRAEDFICPRRFSCMMPGRFSWPIWITTLATILHITTRPAWEGAAASGFYVSDSLRAEGFIHCSKPQQVIRVAHERFKNQTGLVLLEIAENRVRVEIKYENCEGGEEQFPHLYGPLNADAVVGIHPFEANDSGEFELPASLSDG